MFIFVLSGDCDNLSKAGSSRMLKGVVNASSSSSSSRARQKRFCKQFFTQTKDSVRHINTCAAIEF